MKQTDTLKRVLSRNAMASLSHKDDQNGMPRPADFFDEDTVALRRDELEYYNRERPHSSLNGQMIKPWPQTPDGEIMEFSRLGGLLKSYRRVKPEHDETPKDN